MIYFTSDVHFNHNKPFLFEPRGFSSVDEMNRTVCENWNATVAADDEVYMLGDFCFGAADMAQSNFNLINSLNGKIHLIRGNHDTDAKLKLYQQCENIVDIQNAAYFKYKKLRFYLSHYPTLTANFDDNEPFYRHLINLHGHTHQQGNFISCNPYIYHVGLDSHCCKPVAIEQIIADIKQELFLQKQ